MLRLTLIVAVIAAVDSLNPATLAPALYLAGGKRPHASVAQFICGAFAVGALGGCVILLGPGQGLLAHVPRPSHRTGHLLEPALGLALGVVAAVLWHRRGDVGRFVDGEHRWADRSAFTLGAGIEAVELPTAFPYFAAIAAILGSGSSIPAQLSLVALYNAIFVAPLVAIVVTASTGESGGKKLKHLRRMLDRRLSAVVPILLALLASGLIILGTVQLA